MAPQETPATATESITYRPEQLPSGPPDLRLLHFNDVYHLDPSSAEPVGGAARFQTVVNGYRSGKAYAGQPDLLTLFSGDAFNPSLESSITKGSHMVPILNQLGTDCACIGNHDLDFGVAQFEYLAAKCTFPWLVANIQVPAGEHEEEEQEPEKKKWGSRAERDGDGLVPIGGCLRTYMLTASNGLKVGLLGLGEREWLDTVNALPADMVYRSATETARKLIPQLRAAGADIVVVLSHSREPNDNKLAENLTKDKDGDDEAAADLILGGHDHFYAHSLINGTHVLRSGSDFKQLSYLEAWRRPGSDSQPGRRPRWDFSITRRDIVEQIVPDEPTVALIDQLTAKLKQSLEKPIGWTAAPLDARFTTVRLRESNIGNFVCDIMRLHYQADCALMAAGTIRGDQIYPPGPVRVKDITDCFPFEDPVVVVRAPGQAIVDALENGVSLYPALEGRFAHVSNIQYEFDPSKPVGSRVTHVEICGQPAIPDKEYVLCTRGYMVRGKDGYTSLLAKSEGGLLEEIVDEESGILISMMLRQYFMSLKVMDKWSRWNAPMQKHWGRVVSSIDCSSPHVSPVAKKSASVFFKDARDKAQTETPNQSLGLDPSAFSATRSAPDLRRWWSNVTPFNERVVDDASPQQHAEEVQYIDRQLQLMRRVVRKWCRLAGVQSRQCDTLTEDEFQADWTRAIAPRIEGRIRNLGEMVKLSHP